MSDDVKSIGLDSDLLAYVVAHSGGEDPVAAELAAVTRNEFGDLAGMNIEQDQGRFLEFLVGMIGARTVVEVGTFTGMSALFLARGLPEGGRLVCFDLDERFVELGRPYWDPRRRRSRPGPPMSPSTWPSWMPTSPPTAPTWTF
jgi:caffeoyl-CoA O-methyltransferase